MKIQGPSRGIKKRKHYNKLTAKEKTKIASCAVKNGVTAALNHFKHTGEFTELRKSTVHGWKDAYWKQLQLIDDIIQEREVLNPLNNCRPSIEEDLYY